jgi:hypothetical protein
MARKKKTQVAETTQEQQVAEARKGRKKRDVVGRMAGEEIWVLVHPTEEGAYAPLTTATFMGGDIAEMREAGGGLMSARLNIPDEETRARVLRNIEIAREAVAPGQDGIVVVARDNVEILVQVPLDPDLAASLAALLGLRGYELR